MFVLAIDTATTAVVTGVLELTTAGITARSTWVGGGVRKHGELLMPAVLETCAVAGVGLRDIDAIVVGAGPGPFTGLRVGMVTAAALGDALDLPVYGVCSLDAIAADAVPGAGGTPLLVVTDARRREVYWAVYDTAGIRVSGPHVAAPAAAMQRAGELGVGAVAGSPEHTASAGLPVAAPAVPSPAGLVAVAAEAVRAGSVPAPLRPLYLRRPDAVQPGPRKKVSA